MKDGIYIAAPPAQPWQVSVEDVESWFRERWPDAVIDREHDSLTGQGSLTGQDCLDFEVILGGELRRGSFHDPDQLTLRDASPEFWAEFTAWFHNRLPCRPTRTPARSPTSSSASRRGE